MECKDKIYKNFELFNEKGEAIVSIVPLQSHIIVITKECSFDTYGKIDGFSFFAYAMNQCYENSIVGMHIAELYCTPFYCSEYQNINEFRIQDFIVSMSWRNRGIGSLLMKELKKFAIKLKIPRITGWLSTVDIGTDEDIDKKECRNRVYHFYEKHGFLITDQKDIILELYQQN